MDRELRNTLAQAMYKVRELRRENEILRAKVETMDTLSMFLAAQIQHRSIGAEEDIAWRIEQILSKDTETSKA